MRRSDRTSLEQRIAHYGHHVTVVQGPPLPRFAYTIGLLERIGLELLLGGAIAYDVSEVGRILNEIARLLREGHPLGAAIEAGPLGRFKLRKMRSEWVEALMLGAVDFHRERTVIGYQVVPDPERWTIDVPLLDEDRGFAANQAWRWALVEWSYAVPRTSVATTNLGALRGERVTEVARWEPDGWEMFAGAGPDVKPEDARVVPLGVLLERDESLKAALTLPVGGAIWRDQGGGPWQAWGSHNRE